MVFDLLISNGLIVDGTGKPGYHSDIGIKDGTITAIGMLKDASAKKRIDATNLAVTPGFIDTHSHSELRLLEDPAPEEKIRQGITTEILGQDGLSVAPIEEDNIPLVKQVVAGLLGKPNVNWN